jgi:glycosyltransferase involved in cell wall biosynthesis
MADTSFDLVFYQMRDQAQMSSPAKKTVTFVVPCYNESTRLPHAYWAELLALEGFQWVFVNDGSTDNTFEVLENLVAPYPHAHAVNMLLNGGKAEAVRTGLLFAYGLPQSKAVGFIDSDGSFPVSEIIRFAEIGRDANLAEDAIWASRNGATTENTNQPPLVRRIASVIVSALIHYGNPTMPSDTQCGFKLFKPTPELEAALSTPFETRWLFDIELFHRIPGLVVREEPLTSWTDVPNSRISTSQSIEIFKQLVSVLRLGRK